MLTDASQNFPRAASLLVSQDKDQQRTWFVLVLPALMAFLLALVPLLGSMAAGPMLLVLVPLVLWTAFRDTERAVYVYIAWCWIDGTLRGLLNSDPVSIVARDIVLGIIVVGWGCQRLQSRAQDPILYPPGSLLIALFVINCLLQVANPYSLGLIQSIGGLKMHLSAIPLLFVAYDVFRRRSQVRALFLFLTLATLVIGILSFVQYVEGQAWTWAHFPGTKQVISQQMNAQHAGVKIGELATFKPPGTTGFGGGTATFVGLIFPLTFALAMLSEKNGFSQRSKSVFLGILMAFVVIILINSIRSALVMAVTGVIFLGVVVGGRLRARVLVGMLVCLVLGMIALTYSANLSGGGVTDRFSSTFADPVDALHQDRRTFFDDAVFIAVHSPMGVGLGRIGAAAGRLGSGKSNLDFAVFSEAYLGDMMFETGIIGGVLITAIALMLILRGYHSMVRLQQPDDRFLAAGILAVLFVVFANFFVAPILLGPPGSVLFWLLGGVLLRVFAPSNRVLLQVKVEPI